MSEIKLICSDPRWLTSPADAILFQAAKKFRLQVLGKFMSQDPSLGLARPLVYKSYMFGEEYTESDKKPSCVDGQEILRRVIAIFDEQLSSFNDVIVWRMLPEEDGSFFRCAFTAFSYLNPRPYRRDEY